MDGGFRVRPADVVTDPVRRRAYEADGSWNGDTLAGRVSAHARHRGSRTAVIDLGGQRRVSYAELDQDSNRLANALIDWGVDPGDVVSVQLPNWYETVVIQIGVLKAGAILNPLLPIYRANELRHVLTVGAAPIFFGARVYHGFDHAAQSAELEIQVASLRRAVVVDDPASPGDAFRELLDSHSDKPPDVALAPAAPSELIFTSGTEAQPKAVMHSEHTAEFSARATASALGLHDADVVWMPSPIGHSTGLNYGVRVALHHGLPLVLQDAWSAEEAVALVEQLRCSYCVAATTFLSDVIQCGRARDVDLSSMRLFSSGGAPVPAELVRAGEELGMSVLRLYGSTEVLVASWNRPQSPDEKRWNTDGAPLTGIEVRIQGNDGRDVLGAPGEILVRGPNTSIGFFADPKRTAATFEADGWVRTGDLGVMDEDGYLSVVGRKKEIIIRGGLNIAPREVEAMILRHPDVVDVAIVGVPDERLGERACACVVLAESRALELDELVRFLVEEGLATFKLPERIARFDALPRTQTGKVQKFRLVEELRRSGLPVT
jgi:acyl-CoA synthetase (AMP-forming)/AMP-acid ligase II